MTCVDLSVDHPPTGLSANAEADDLFSGDDQELLGLDGDLGDEVAIVKVAPRLFPIFASFALGRTPLYVVTLHQLTATGKGEQKSQCWGFSIVSHL